MEHQPQEPGQRSRPTTPSGEAWRQAEQFNRRLAEMGDTPRSFLVKGLIGTVFLLGLLVGSLWLLYKLVRWFI